MSNKLFPGVSTDLSGTDRNSNIRKKIQASYDEHMAQNTQFQEEARTDSLLEAGDQKTLNSLGFNRVLPYMDMYTNNKIKRVVNLVSGIQRRERKSTIATPLDDSDQKTADQLTKILFNLNNNYGGLEAISDGYQSAIITGLSLLQLYVDYRNDPISGEIKIDVCPYNSFIIDPSFVRTDMSDCDFVWKRSYLTENECISLLPEHKKDIQDIAKSSTGTDDIFPYLFSSYMVENKKLAYDEYYYRDYRKQKLLIDTVSGETIEYSGQDDSILPLFLKKNPTLILKVIDKPTVKLAILVNGNIFYDGLNPSGIDSYPFVPIFGYKSLQVTDMYLKFQGLVRGMRDSQFLYNLSTSLEVEYVQSRVNPGVIYKPTSLIDPKAVQRKDLSGGLALQKNATMDDVRFVNPMEIPQSVSLIREQAAKELVENSGGNEELLGSSENKNISGILSKTRQMGGLTILQPLLDGLDASQYVLGLRQIELIQCNYTPGKIKRIIDEEPTQEFYNKTFSKYDCSIEEGVNTTTQRQNQFTTMMAMREAGINLPDEIILKASTIQNKQEIIDFMNEKAQQEAQAQQQETQITQQLQQEEAGLAHARANRDNANAAESMAKIEDNRTQAIANLAEANKDDERATLDKVKAMKELEDMDLAQLEKFISLVSLLKGEEQVAKEQLLNNNSSSVGDSNANNAKNQ